MKKRHMIDQDRKTYHVFQEQLLRCGDCNELFGVWIEIDVPIKQGIRQLMAICCPECRSTNILQGQSRTIAEDKDFRTEGSVEERAEYWLENGELGLSALSICYRLLGRKNPWNVGTPKDPSDLRRCLLLLDRIPEWKDRMSELAAVAGWKNMALHWNEIVSAFEAEVGTGLDRKPAPLTAGLIDKHLAEE